MSGETTMAYEDRLLVTPGVLTHEFIKEFRVRLDEAVYRLRVEPSDWYIFSTAAKEMTGLWQEAQTRGLGGEEFIAAIDLLNEAPYKVEDDEYYIDTPEGQGTYFGKFGAVALGEGSLPPGDASIELLRNL